MQTVNTKIMRSKAALRDALCELLNRKELADISVSELCRKAKINRTTFYKYYALPKDVLREYVLLMFEEALPPNTGESAHSESVAIHNCILKTCRLYYKNELATKLFMTSSNDVFDILLSLFDIDFKQDFIANSIYSFIAGGVAAIILQWGMAGFEQSPEEIADTLTAYIQQLFAVH